MDAYEKVIQALFKSYSQGELAQLKEAWNLEDLSELLAQIASNNNLEFFKNSLKNYHNQEQTATAEFQERGVDEDFDKFIFWAVQLIRDFRENTPEALWKHGLYGLNWVIQFLRFISDNC